MKQQMIRIGNFFFHYRNRLFPLIMLGLFALAIPPVTLFGSQNLEYTKDIIAVVIALLGLAFRGMVIGYAYIKRGGLNKKVYAENLVTQGIFAICRNPLYVGNILIYTGVFLLHGAPLVMLLGMTTFLFIYQCIVLAEEAYLQDKFGEGYSRYCKEVPRWVPDFSQFKHATEGMRFNLNLAIMKDYSTIATTIVTLALTQIYKYAATEASSHTDGIWELSMLILATGIAAASIRYIKKHKPKTP